jgi:hypothetical protein
VSLAMQPVAQLAKVVLRASLCVLIPAGWSCIAVPYMVGWVDDAIGAFLQLHSGWAQGLAFAGCSRPCVVGLYYLYYIVADGREPVW